MTTKGSTLHERAAAVAQQVPLGGPLSEFEQVGRLQLEVLIHEGLCPRSNVLDVGCGALRGGYWLMHFLEPGRYFGIEPYRQMLEAGLEHIVEPEVVEAKHPRFDSNTQFDFSVFGVRFDFVLARSIWTHASMDQIKTMLDRFVAVAAPGALLVASYFRWPPPIRTSPRFFSSVLLSQRERLYERLPGARDVLDRYFGTRVAGFTNPVAPDGGAQCLPAKMIPHTFGQIRQACQSRGLSARDLDYGMVNNQRWIRIQAP